MYAKVILYFKLIIMNQLLKPLEHSAQYCGQNAEQSLIRFFFNINNNDSILSANNNNDSILSANNNNDSISSVNLRRFTEENLCLKSGHLFDGFSITLR